MLTQQNKGTTELTLNTLETGEDLRDGGEDLEALDNLSELDLDLGGLRILEPPFKKRVQSWNLNKTNLRIGRFCVTERGIVKTPAGANLTANSLGLKIAKIFSAMKCHEQYIKLGVIGQGGSSTVYRALHVPTLQLVAIKEIPLFDRGKRHQLGRELSMVPRGFNSIWQSSSETEERSLSDLPLLLKKELSSPLMMIRKGTRAVTNTLSGSSFSSGEKGESTFKKARRRLKKLSHRRFQAQLNKIKQKIQSEATLHSVSFLTSSQSKSKVKQVNERSGKCPSPFNARSTEFESPKSLSAKSRRSNQPQACPFIVHFRDVFTGATTFDQSLTSEDRHTSALQVSIVMDYMVASLGGLLERQVNFDEDMVAHIARRGLLSLAYLHLKGILHRDVKPANFLVSQDGNILLADFGLVGDIRQKAASSSSSGSDSSSSSSSQSSEKDDNKPLRSNMKRGKEVSKTKSFVGTYNYMSPERINGEPYSYASDIWSLGLTCLHLTTGKFPISEKGSRGYWAVVAVAQGNLTPDAPPPSFSELFCDFITECLRVDPLERPSALELLAHPFLHQNKQFDNSLRHVPSVHRINAHLDAVEAFEDGLLDSAELEELLATFHFDRHRFDKVEASGGPRGFFWKDMWRKKNIRQNQLSGIHEENRHEVANDGLPCHAVSDSKFSTTSSSTLRRAESSDQVDLFSTHSSKGNRENNPLLRLTKLIGSSRSVPGTAFEEETSSESDRGRLALMAEVMRLHTAEENMSLLMTMHRKLQKYHAASDLHAMKLSSSDVRLLAKQLRFQTQIVKDLLNSNFRPSDLVR